MIDRKSVSKEDLRRAEALVKNVLAYKLAEKGDHGMKSSHEIFGLVTEEYNELAEAIHINDPEALKSELVDLAVACLIGIASINAKTIDW